ncbi:MAG: aminoglycoside adenylyltransferase domain-containing protein [Dermatophilaceae bacterium]
MADERLSRAPTAFAELNAVLIELTERAMAILGDNFVGAYLQGSFAVGDADLHSDCDFLIPTHEPVNAEQEAGLRALHDEIPTRTGHWVGHLEGSYPLARELKTLEGLGRAWPYVDHGSRQLEFSAHCNTEVVRWSLRECGITIAGPDPKTVVEEVSAQVLRNKMREYARTFLPDLETWATFDVAWVQRYAVSTLCRILHTLDRGRVTSKKAALAWGRDNLDPAWSPLLQQVIGDRVLGFDADSPPRPGSVEQTMGFLEYAKARAVGSAQRA